MIRKAILDDVNAIHALLALYGKKGELLARPLSKLYDHLRDFWVYEDPKQKKSGWMLCFTILLGRSCRDPIPCR